MFFTTTQQLREGSEYLYMQAGQNHQQFQQNRNTQPTIQQLHILQLLPPLLHMQQCTAPLLYFTCSNALLPSSTFHAAMHCSPPLPHMQQCTGSLLYLSCSNALLPSSTFHAAMHCSPPLPHMQQCAGLLPYLTCSNALVPSPTSHAARRWSPPLPHMSVDCRDPDLPKEVHSSVLVEGRVFICIQPEKWKHFFSCREGGV